MRALSSPNVVILAERLILLKSRRSDATVRPSPETGIQEACKRTKFADKSGHPSLRTQQRIPNSLNRLPWTIRKEEQAKMNDRQKVTFSWRTPRLVQRRPIFSIALAHNFDNLDSFNFLNFDTFVFFCSSPENSATFGPRQVWYRALPRIRERPKDNKRCFLHSPASRRTSRLLSCRINPGDAMINRVLTQLDQTEFLRLPPATRGPDSKSSASQWIRDLRDKIRVHGGSG